jgi:spore coat polysaccharide biosynthesis protein SpsF (cytidylyltransferase family)
MSLGNVGIVVAARTGSQRLPGKALLPLSGVPMIAYLLRRQKPVRGVTLVLATTQLPADDALAELAAAEGVPLFRGADADVVARYVAAAERFALDTVVRVTGDCPFVSAELVDYCIERAAGSLPFDLATTKTRFPVGLDAEIFRADSMARLHRSGRLTAVEREHLTLYYYNHAGAHNIRYIEPLPSWLPVGGHLTVDVAADYEFARKVAAALPAGDLSIEAVLQSADRYTPKDSTSTGRREAS